MGYAGDITPEQTWALLQDNADAVLVDCRSAAEWEWVGVPDLSALGRDVRFVEWNHSSGEHNGSFVADLLETGLTPGTPVVFLCRSGKRSALAAAEATAAGIEPCYNVIDGFEGQIDENSHRGVGGWRAVGMPWRQS